MNNNPIERIKEITGYSENDCISLVDLRTFIGSIIVCDAMSEEEQISLISMINAYLFDEMRSDRLIGGVTFAPRLILFLSGIVPGNEVENGLLKKFSDFSNDLLEYQIQTANSTLEINYLRNISIQI